MKPDNWFAQSALATVGFVLLALVPLGAAWALHDHRLVQGNSVALKPTKFALSIGVYLLTTSWMLGYARPDRLSSPLVRGATCALLIGAAVELFCIFVQAARGRQSHFNFETAVDAVISAVMAITAVLFIGMLLPLAWEIARRPRPDAAPLMIVAIVTGLVATFTLGGLSGAGMGRIASGVVARRDLLLPIVGWRLAGGSARIAHFLGVHAMQAFPLMAAGALLMRGRLAVILFAACVASYLVVTLALVYEAARPLSTVAPLPFTEAQRLRSRMDRQS